MRHRWALLLLLSTVAACTTHASSRTTTTTQIVYRVEDLTSAPPRVTTVVVDVASHETGRTRTLGGPPPGTVALGGAAWSPGHAYLLRPDGSAAEISAAPPAFADVDTHLDVALPVAARLRLVAPAGRGAVAGVACDRWTSRDPLDSGPPAPATTTDTTTSCVDAAGHVLEDRWTLHGNLVRTRTAVQVGSGPSLSGRALLSGAEPSPAPTDSPLQVKEVGSARLATALGIPLPAGPTGLRADRSAALITIEQGSSGRQVGEEGGVFSWTDGPHLVLLRVERGLLRPLSLPTGGSPVPGSSSARLTPVPVGLQLQLLTSQRLLVTATGNLPEDALVTWFEGLRWASGP